MADRTKRVVTREDNPLVNWTVDPIFEFDAEIDALEMLQDIGEELRMAREHVRNCMRYMTAAVQAAGKVREDGQAISKQAIIGASGVARQTIYDILGERPGQ